MNFDFWFFFQIFHHKKWHLLWHISWPGGLFPSSNWAHTWSSQSSNIVLKQCLRISWSVKYFCQKYGVKGSKLCTSAGTPRISRRPVQRQRWGRVLRTILFKNHWILHENAVFLVLGRFRVDLGSFLKKRQKFKFSSKSWHFCDTFPLRIKSSRGPIELILSQLKALIQFSRNL